MLFNVREDFFIGAILLIVGASGSRTAPYNLAVKGVSLEQGKFLGLDGVLAGRTGPDVESLALIDALFAKELFTIHAHTGLVQKQAADGAVKIIRALALFINSFLDICLNVNLVRQYLIDSYLICVE